MIETLGIFPDFESAGRAVERLVREGFAEAQITSLTSVSYPDGALVKTGRRSWFRWLTLGCFIAGAAAGFALAAGTAWLYPVQTGEKPIIAYYPTGIVTYELAMLFALAGTIVGMFLEMGLPAWRKRPYDPAIAEGCIGISVTIHPGGEAVVCGREAETGACVGGVVSLSAGEQKSRAEEIMREAGALRIVAEEPS
ncbi:quinol:electron acceptor oxidoreductase subunit ActD [Geobacter sp.]|uniref:quinol:electron acceptor oxidoreductase subunit ActD n=1 Tax=Geobacter sp. TaxID=46610 RepID=UPI002632E945|nr:quinol:electron acceptor oxidoreductase subunit ActD [Geobacter sp.]